MNGRMKLEEFKVQLNKRNIADFVNNTSNDISRYSGAEIHALPSLQRTLLHIKNWTKLGWFEATPTFEELAIENPELYGQLVRHLYIGFSKQLYKI